MGMSYGLMVVMVLYNLFLFFSLRDRTYLNYSLAVVSIGLMTMSGDRHTAEYFWPDRAWGFWRPFTFFSNLQLALIGRFVQSFLLTRDYTPRMHRVISYFSFVMLLWSLLQLTDWYYILDPLWSPMTGAWCIVILATGVICLRRGNRFALFFLISWTIPLVAAVNGTLTIMGVS